MSRQNRALHYLQILTSQPTASFHEQRVYAALEEQGADLLNHPLVSKWYDAFGNMHLLYRPDGARWKVALAAHMDHPAFEVDEVTGDVVKGRIMGGLPRNLLDGAKVLFHPAGAPVKGHVKEVVKDHGEWSADVLFEAENPERLTVGDFATLDFPSFVLEGEAVRGTVMDDLAGCSAALATLERAVEEHSNVEVRVLLHRAEEVGFVGAIAVAQSGTLPKDTIVVSLEASKTLPGAEVGKGPVIREGDKTFWFDRNAEQFLQAAAEELRGEGIPIQSRRMVGGTCEATAYMAYGYSATGCAVPLMNYHNNGETAVAPEAININDLAGEVELLYRMIQLMGKTGIASFQETRQRIDDNFTKWKGKLSQFPNP